MTRWRSPTINELVNAIPFDGCLLVFNAPVNSWYKAIYLHCAGMLGIMVVAPAPYGTRIKNIRAMRVVNKPVDLYIHWKV